MLELGVNVLPYKTSDTYASSMDDEGILWDSYCKLRESRVGVRGDAIDLPEE